MAKKQKQTDAEKVTEYMDALEHPLKAEIETVRILKTADPRISERIKWNAPSYYYLEDLVTFHVRPQDKVHLVFHHPEIVPIASVLLEGDYKDRRMVYFRNMEEIERGKGELGRIVRELILKVENAK